MIRVDFSQAVEFGRNAMNMPMSGPGVGGGTRDEPVTVVLRRDPAMLSGAFQFFGQRVQFHRRFISRIAQASLLVAHHA